MTMKTADHLKALTFLQQRSDFEHVCDIADAIGARDGVEELYTESIMRDLLASGDVVNYEPNTNLSSYWRSAKEQAVTA